MKEAKKIIENKKNLYASTKARLISMLELVDELHAIPNAKEHVISAGNNEFEKEKLRNDFNIIGKKSPTS